MIQAIALHGSGVASQSVHRSVINEAM